MNIFLKKAITFDAELCSINVTPAIQLSQNKQGSTSANLKRHLKRHHRQAFDRVEEKDSVVTKKQNCRKKKGKVV